MSLAGKRAVITGSNSGIGLGVAEALAAAGAEVVLNSFTDRPEDHELARDLGARHKVTARYIAADMSNGAECRALIEKAGGCDILVNNAGIQFVSPIEEFPVEKWDAILAINLSSAFHTIAAALPGMRAKGWGRIVDIASAHGLTASPYKSAYVAAKHAIVGLTKTVALETAGDGIRINAVAPGGTETPNFLRVMNGDAHAMDAMVPMGRIGQPAEVADAVVWLLSDQARYVTGAVLSVDGGLAAG